jgi:hypothetical protein
MSKSLQASIIIPAFNEARAQSLLFFIATATPLMNPFNKNCPTIFLIILKRISPFAQTQAFGAEIENLSKLMLTNRTHFLNMLFRNLQLPITTNTKPSSNMKTPNTNLQTCMVELVPCRAKNSLSLTLHLNDPIIPLMTAITPIDKTATTLNTLLTATTTVTAVNEP